MKYTIEELYQKQGELVCEGCRQTGGLQVSFIDKVEKVATLVCRCKSAQRVELEIAKEKEKVEPKKK
jgi:hypothetical protein